MADESWRGKIGKLDNDEIEGFLAEAHIARLACLDADGWPYVVPCWHEWDGDAFWVVPREKSAWAKPPAARAALRDHDRRGGAPAQGDRPVPRRAGGGAEPRRPLGGVAERMSTALPGRERPEVPRADARQAALAVPAGAGEGADVAGPGLGGPLQVTDPVELARALIRAPSPNPPGDERAVAAADRGAARELGPAGAARRVALDDAPPQPADHARLRPRRPPPRAVRAHGHQAARRRRVDASTRSAPSSTATGCTASVRPT